MSSQGEKISIRVVETVARALGKDPTELPAIEQTISADALDRLFHEGDQPSGAYTIFPYSGVWVLVHSDGTVDVFDGFKATSTEEVVPEEVPEGSAADRLLVLHVDDERHAFQGEELETVHEIVDEAEDGSEAWSETIEYAQER